MRILLVTLSDLLVPVFQNCLNLENDYCAIVVDDVQAAKKILVPQGYPEEKIFPFYDLKECVENFYYDVLLFIADGRLFWGDLPEDFLKYGVPQNKIVHMDLTSMHTENAFLMEHALRYFREHSGEFEMFSTGISYTCHALDSEQFKAKLFNFGRSNQDLYFDFQIAKFVLSGTGGGGNIRYALIGSVPYIFYYDLSKTYKYRRALLQYVIAFGDVHNFELPVDKYKNLLRENFFDYKIYGFTNFDTNNVFLEKKSSVMSTEEFAKLRKNAEKWNDKDYPETRKENIKILDDYLTLCEENNVTPIIFLPPMTDGHMKYFSRQKLDEFYYLINAAIKKHPGTKFFDGWKLPIFSYENFWDSTHLNRKGAAKFSAMFNEFIEGLEKNQREVKILYTKKIYFSGGDFHELQELFNDLPGVMKVTAGYIDARNVSSQVNPEPRTVENFPGVEIEFNPKKMDLSMLMDVLFNVLNPYAENNLGVYYSSAEDEPQIELHMNFIANRGKQPAATGAMLTVNDPNHNPKFARKCYVAAGRLTKFSPAGEEHQNYFQKHPEIKTDIDFKKLKASLKF